MKYPHFDRQSTRRTKSSHLVYISLLVAIVAWILIDSDTASADLVYDSGVNVGAVDYGYYSFTSSVVESQYIAAGFLQVPPLENWHVDGASWTGFLAEGGEYPESVGRTFEFDLLFYAARDGAFVPTGTAVAYRTVSVTGEDSGRSGIAEYNAEFESITLNSDTRYFFAVVPRGEFTFLNESNRGGLGWLWSAKQGGGYMANGGTEFRDEWGSQRAIMDFSLYGTVAAVPEPSSFLVMLGLATTAGIGYGIKRRRKTA